MASSGPSHGDHLDASSGRQVVFCHACEHEWYNDQHGLRCPRCDSEVCEIISPENDPRAVDDGSMPHGAHYDDDQDSASDPDEGDIEEHVHNGPNGFFIQEMVYHSPMDRRDGATRGPGQRIPADPSDGGDIFRAFTDMLSRDFRVGNTGRSDLESLFPSTGAEDAGSFGQPSRHIHQTTFSGPRFSGGSTTFTIATGPVRRGLPGSSGPPGLGFDAVFGNIMGSGAIPPPQPNNNGPNAGGSPLPGFAASLSDIIASLINPASAVRGDAVYSQEALDRIITQLMETHPQSNAAPPASQSAIEQLEKKKLDAKMMGENGKAECTICIDELNIGDEVVVLPCKHWFHGECVVLWLNEHNTCPICRHPIEDSNNVGNASSQQPQHHQTSPHFSPAAFFQTRHQPNTDLASWQPANPDHTLNPNRQRSSGGRTASENEDRLNAIRNLAGSSYRTDSARPRRDSWSPISPIGSRTRVRSPSPSSREGQQFHTSYFGSGGNRNQDQDWRDRDAPREDRDRSLRSPWGSEGSGQQTRERPQDGRSQQDRSHQSGSGGAFSWIRDRFSGNSGEGSSGGRRQS